MNHSSHHPCRILSYAYLPYSAPLLRRREPYSIFAKQITFHQLFSVRVCQFSRQLNSFPRRHHGQLVRCKMASTLPVCICLDVSVIIFPLKGHFLVIHYRGVETNWMNSLVRAGFHKWMREEPIFTCNQHKVGKKRQKVVTPDQWVVSFLPSVPNSNGTPPPMLRCLPRSIKAAQARGRQESVFYLC